MDLNHVQPWAYLFAVPVELESDSGGDLWDRPHTMAVKNRVASEVLDELQRELGFEVQIDSANGRRAYDEYAKARISFEAIQVPTESIVKTIVETSQPPFRVETDGNDLILTDRAALSAGEVTRVHNLVDGPASAIVGSQPIQSDSTGQDFYSRQFVGWAISSFESPRTTPFLLSDLRDKTLVGSSIAYSAKPDAHQIITDADRLASGQPTSERFARQSTNERGNLLACEWHDHGEWRVPSKSTSWPVGVLDSGKQTTRCRQFFSR